MDRADLATASWPQWLRARRNAEIRPEPSPAGPGTVALATGAYVETTGEAQGRWARVFCLGNGRLDGAIEGWIDSDGRGYARLIPAETIERAMSLASVQRAAFAAGP